MIKTFFQYLFKLERHSSRKVFFWQFVPSLIIVILVMVSLQFTSHLVFFKEIKDFVVDNLMYWHSDFEPTLANGQPMQRMALIAIDDNSYRDWGFPVITPHDKLQALIEKAVQGGANVIAVDLEIAWANEGYVRTDAQLPLSPTDQTLADYLHKLNESNTVPPIILTGMYRNPLENNIVNGEAWLEKVPSFLDRVLKAEKNVFWASSLFDIDEDRFWRRGQLTPLVCENGHLTLVPSLALLTALAQLHMTDSETQSARQAIRDLKMRLNHWTKQFACDIELEGKKTLAQLVSKAGMTPAFSKVQMPDFTVTLPQKGGINDKSHLINLIADEEAARIIYRFAPPEPSSSETKRQVFIKIYSAVDVLAYDIIDFKDKIVFIGTTHQDNCDRHPIPIRELIDVDGVYIVANATDTLLRFGQVQSQSQRNKMITSIFLVIFMVVSFTCFNIFRASLFSTVLLVILSVWAYYQLYQGIITDIALYSLALQICQTVIKIVFVFFKPYQNGETEKNAN
jgi:CHASE2 domain-containing sensor protein